MPKYEVHVHGHGIHFTPHHASCVWQHPTQSPDVPALVRVSRRRPEVPSQWCELAIVPKGGPSLEPSGVAFALGESQLWILGGGETPADGVAHICGSDWTPDWHLRTRGHQMRWPSSFYLSVSPPPGREYLVELGGPITDPTSLASVAGRGPEATIVLDGPYARSALPSVDALRARVTNAVQGRSGRVDWLEGSIRSGSEPLRGRHYLLLGGEQTAFLLTAQGPERAWARAVEASDVIAESFVYEGKQGERIA